jgi:(1->4)-alpha-D-glucan 1-alpha-D-glucosylmutase
VTPLQQLAERHGIGARYHDVWGNLVEVEAASLIALLGELGVDARSPESVEAALAAPRGPEPLLPEVLVATADETRELPLAREAPAPLGWRLELEDGGRIEGALDLGSRTLALPQPLPAGYHRLVLLEDRRGEGGHALCETFVIAAPSRCWQPAEFERNARLWGPAVQLYGLRSAHNWGIGDFSDLLHLVEQWAALGAGLLGLNPLFALFPNHPAQSSPYSPSSRLALNVLYLDVEAIEDFREAERVRRQVRARDFQRRLEALREAPLVDYAGVTAAKLEILEGLYAHFRERHLARSHGPGQLGSPRGRAFRAWQANAGDALARHALHEALVEHFQREDSSLWGWPVWPEPYRDPAGEAVTRFRAERVARIEYYEWLQWQAELQLARVRMRCEALGMPLGLYLDLPVSADRGGSEVWAWRECFAPQASVGAPPDAFNLKGQDWGLPPLAPHRLRAARYQPLVRALRTAMRHAGALRIDHVMGLMRLFWIPPGRSAAEGAYVHYRLDEMLAVVALESVRNSCLVVGEDLGTVPDEVRDALARRGVLSYRLFYFEREPDGAFKPATAYPRDALVAVGTHDLPTLAGWWNGRDIALRREHGLYTDPAQLERMAEERGHERARLAARLDQTPGSELSAELIGELHAFLAATPARVMLVQPEDALGVEEQANLPGTVNEHPNWRHKFPLRVEEVSRDARIEALAAAIRRARPSPRRAASSSPRAASSDTASAASDARSAASALPAAKIPRATFRVQLHREFGFAEATGLVPYLARLGISHLYCSPILRARPGSRHGYDVVSHDEINPELGGREGFARLVAALRGRGMGILLDVVPNHMAIGPENVWWMDVLENGPASEHAAYFDIDWQPVNVDLAGKVLLPVLGDHYGSLLDSGALELAPAAGGGFVLRYAEHRFPLDMRTLTPLLERAEQALDPGLATPAARNALRELIERLAALPARDAVAEADSVGAPPAEQRRAALPALKRELAQLLSVQPAVASALERALAELNSAPREALHALLEAQAWRLAYWRIASDEINYRRFFDVNELAALRMEHESAFEATHATVLGLAADGQVEGLRIDHPDGLYDPAQYFERLQQGYAWRTGAALAAEGGRPARPLYVVAEKIAAAHERLPERWALHGTTGYDYAAAATALFVDPAAATRIDRIWRRFSGLELDFEEAAYRGKKTVLFSALAAELTMLATRLWRIARSDRRTRDYTLHALRQALAEVAACMPVYRTYITSRAPEGSDARVRHGIDARVSAQDRRYIEWALGAAQRRSRAADLSVFGFLREMLLGNPLEGGASELGELALSFARRFQQFTSPLAAKGIEDTAGYQFNRLIALNDVGADPLRFGMTPAQFHRENAERAARWPHTLLAASTHDNKRSADVRLRIAVISEMPGQWLLLLKRWRALNRNKVLRVDGRPAPSANDQYLLYQTLLGSFPAGDDPPSDAALEAYRARIEQTLLKAAREQKENTSWLNPDEAYEKALSGFVQALLTPAPTNRFLDELRRQAAGTAWFGALSSISQALIHYSAPGVPDLYQGNELLDYSLVDPDNRRPVDYALRRRLLDELMQIGDDSRASAAQSLATAALDGRAKLYTIWRLLEQRREQPLLFRDGSYRALAAEGAHAAHVLAYARDHADGMLIAIAGRLYAKLLREPGRLPLGEVWGDTRVRVGADGVDSARFRDLFSGEIVETQDGVLSLAQLLQSFPVAALVPVT